MKTPKLPPLPPSEITPPERYFSRREIMAGLAGGAALAIGPTAAGEAVRLKHSKNARFSASDPPSSRKDITTCNNFYEFGTDKADPARLGGRFRPQPRARYVAFKTVLRPEEMPGQRVPVLRWPYVEALRMDEAVHPLTILAVGLYGEVLPNQNGAPLRLVVPWKYGFKSIKSIVEIRFTERQPPRSWNISAPQEYGFYANVNPAVDHPRWSQAREHRIGSGVFAPRVPTALASR